MTGRVDGVAVGLSLLVLFSVVAAVAPVSGSAAPASTVASGNSSAVDVADAGTVSADTLVVDGSGGTNYTSIQTAVNDAADGDTVAVRPGTYEEGVSIEENITLVAPDGATLDGSSLDDIDGISVRQSVSPTIEGFAITDYRSGVNFLSGSRGDWTVRDVTVTDSDWDAVRADGSSGDWRIEDVTIADNDGRGVVADDTSGDWVIADATIRNNVGSPANYRSAEGVGVYAHGSTGDWTVRNTVIRGHDVGWADGVGAHRSTGDWTVESSTIAGNGDGVAAWQSSGNWSLVDTTVADNGDGVTADESDGAWTITGSAIRNNSDQSAVGQAGSGVRAADSAGAWSVHDTTITRNGAHGVNATGAVVEGDATRNWWGQAGGPLTGQCVGNVDCGSGLDETPADGITECTVIDESGRYHLATDLSDDGTCIEIRASDVALDGRGHTVEGTDPNTDKTGIYANGTDGGLTNVTVSDVVMNHWYRNQGGHDESILFERVDDGAISGVEVTGGDFGILLVDSDGNRLADNTLTGTVPGQPAVQLNASSEDNALVNNSITRAGGRGIRLSSAPNNTVRGNDVVGSEENNIRVVGGSHGNVFVDNKAHKSGSLSHGIFVGTTNEDLVFRNNTVTGNDGHGIEINQAGSEYVIADNTVRGNRQIGVYLYYVSNATVRNNEVAGNLDNGIELFSVSDSTVAANAVSQNTGYGVSVHGTGVSVSDNRIASNGAGGIHLDRGSSNVLVNNTVSNSPARGTATYPTGIQFDESTDNVLRANTVVNSWRGIDVNASSNGNTLVDNAVYDAGSGTWALTISESTGTVVESLDVGDSSAPNTTVSFEGADVSVASNASPPSNGQAQGIDRYLDARRVRAGGYLNLTLHYERADLGTVPASALGLWVRDGTGWSEVGGATVDPSEQTVRANVTSLSTIGAFGRGSGTTTATGTGLGPGTTSSGGPTVPETTSGSGPGFGTAAALLALAFVGFGRRYSS